MRGEDPDQTKVAIADPLLGTVVDRRYRIEFRLAAGGFGAIYRAQHVINRRHVALKILHASLATEPEIVARFRREADALSQLQSPHTVKAFDFGQTGDGVLYIAMELLQGESLYERFRALGPLPWQRMVTIARQVCDSLGEAHDLGIVHRDLKPTNIHLEEFGGDPDYVKVLDFGIAKILHGSMLDNADLTRTGQMVGTFDYMAPEQMVGGQTSGQSDIYTLGIVMYEMITGERPFGNPETPAAMLTAMLAQTPSPMAMFAEVPDDLEVIVARCLDREVGARYATVQELDADLERVLALDEATKTQVARVPPGVQTAPTVAQTHAVTFGESPPEDSLTWLDRAPTAPAAPSEPASPPHAAANLVTTLPGIVPPSRGTPWPLDDPKKRPKR
jgi:eukaryotic-like serine/threonine-protein kinase